MNNEVLFVSIVNRGKAEGVLTELRTLGIVGGLVFMGSGTYPNKVLEFLGLEEIQKEILIVPVSRLYEIPLHNMVKQVFKFDRKNKGIAFSMPLSRFNDRVNLEPSMRFDPSGFEYHCITVIIDKGKSKECVKIAHEAGAPGGTIMHGRGAGVPADTIFPITIEPEKDVVILLVKSGEIEKIRSRLVDELKLDEPGNGILFVLPVSKTTGLRQTVGGSESENANGGKS